MSALTSARMVAALRQMQAEGTSQATLAKKIGVSQGMVSEYVRGAPPKADKVETFAQVFDIRMDFFTDPALGDAPDYRRFVGRRETHVEREDESHPVIEAFILEQRLDQTEADDLRRQVCAWDGRFIRDELLMLLPAIRMRAARLKAEAEGKPDPAPRELPPVPEGRRRVPPGKKGR